jgi:general secretion pathway protein I
LNSVLNQTPVRLLKKRSGFTLLETLLAVVILASAMILLANSWSAAFMKIRKTQQQFEVASLLERKMTELEIEYRGKPLEEIQDDRNGDFGTQYPQYSWKMASKKLEIPDVSSAMAAADGGSDAMTMSLVKQLTEGLSKSVKEVTVTVVLQAKPKPVEYSVTTYFIDFDKEIPMGVPSGQ